MTYIAQIDILNATTTGARDTKRYLKAYAIATDRAPHSYFDQHIVRMDDGRYWVADEGSYETLMKDLIDRIVHTIPGGKSDDG